jgi:hypothetical protein
MNAIETTATFEGPAHLRLTHPVDKIVTGEVRVILLFRSQDDLTSPAPPPFQMPDFEAIQRQIFGDDVENRILTPEDSTFIRDRGER